MRYLNIFFKKFNKPCINFSRVWTKYKLLEIFEKFLKFFDENSIEKLSFFLFFIIYFLENLLLKIEPSEITPFFYNNFSVSGGGFPPFPPWYALANNTPSLRWISKFPNLSLKSSIWAVIVHYLRGLNSPYVIREVVTHISLNALSRWRFPSPIAIHTTY